MKIINSCSLSARLRGELPPSVPLPATLQTVGGRWFPFAYLEYCQARRGEMKKMDYLSTCRRSCSSRIRRTSRRS